MEPYITFVALNTIMVFCHWATIYLTKKLKNHIKTVSKIYFWTRERKINELSRSKKEVGRRKREKKRK